MLVLTRKPNQQLTIGKDIVITVVKVRGNTIRLGIDAPKDVRVIRSELELRIDNGLTADLEPADEAVDTNTSPDSHSILTASIVMEDNADVAVAPTSDVPSRSTSKSNGSSTRSATTSHVAMKSTNNMTSGSMTSGNGAAPLRGFKSTRASQSIQHGPSAARNQEDSPMCHRSSLGQRELSSSQASQMGIGSLTSNRTW